MVNSTKSNYSLSSDVKKSNKTPSHSSYISHCLQIIRCCESEEKKQLHKNYILI